MNKMYMYKINIRSRHPSHKVLRLNLPKLPIPSVVRFGSTTEVNYHCVEINTIESIKISSDKKLMKERFDEAQVKTAPWVYGNSIEEILNNLEKKEIPFPIVAKSRLGSRGIGNTLLDDHHNLRNWASGRDLSRYIFEKFVNYALEFRLHVTKDGYFYTCRKALKKDADQNSKWRRHIDNSVWLLETNKNFNKPNSWDEIVADCVKALVSIGADVLSVDVKVQSATNQDGSRRKKQNYILLETNSASSMKAIGDGISICAQKYLDILPELIMSKNVVK